MKRPSRAGPSLAVWGGVITVAALAAGVPLSVVTKQGVLGASVQVLIVLPFAVVGAVVAAKQPRNAVGYLLLSLGLVSALLTDGGLYAVMRYRDGYDGLPFGRLAVALTPYGFLTILLILPLVVLLFPDGHLPSRRWRPALWGYLAIWSVVLGGSVVATWPAFTESHVVVDSSGQMPIFNHATGWYAAITGIATPFYGLFGLSFVVAQVLAYRRARGERRAQLKWLLAGGAFSVASLTFVISVGNSKSVLVQAATVIAIVAVVALPIAIGVGILKYRLYDIDRLVSRTLSYTLLTATLIAVFAAFVLVATRVLPFSSSPAVAASTLAVAALFAPLRARLQRLVDRRFNRAGYDAETIVSGFSSRLRNAVDLDSVQAELVMAVDRAIEPAHLSLWIKPDRALDERRPAV
jgi:hypothetical protein